MHSIAIIIVTLSGEDEKKYVQKPLSYKKDDSSRVGQQLPWNASNTVHRRTWLELCCIRDSPWSC